MNDCQWHPGEKRDGVWVYVCKKCGREYTSRTEKDIAKLRRACPKLLCECVEMPSQDGKFAYQCLHCGTFEYRDTYVTPDQIEKQCNLPAPTLAERAKAFGKAMAEYAASGFENVGTAERDCRLAICNACRLQDGAVCRLCGCVLRAKAWGKVWKCPAGKWDV
jgi:DNA-directed RNA polymerase subunit RPC12/RpoP